MIYMECIAGWESSGLHDLQQYEHMLHALDLYDDDTKILHKQASLTTTERYTRDVSDVVARLIHISHILVLEPKHL